LSSTAFATAWPVTSCDDNGLGTLRDVVGAAMTNDTVDLSGLVCPDSRISLTTGAITVDQDTLQISGPGAAALTVDASGLGTSYGDYRVFTHTGTGTLVVSDLGLTGGHVNHFGVPSAGGCVYSSGDVALINANVSSCSAQNAGSFDTSGGAVYTKGDLTLKYSALSGSTASSAGGNANGGGACALGDFGAIYSTISGNSASGNFGFGGGLTAGGNVTIARSTVSGNSSTGNIGGIDAFSASPAGLTTQIISSTISGNSSGSKVGGVYTNSATVKVYSSTIAFNTAVVDGGVFGPGLALSGQSVAESVNMQSSILSNNTYGLNEIEDDLTAVAGANGVTFNVGPANNLVRATFVPGLPSDTLKFACPLLGQLRDNGGLTKTHALQSHSSAIDTGNNAIGDSFDQRSDVTINKTADYPRVSGTFADIGAYEVQQADIIFNYDFQGCPVLF